MEKAKKRPTIHLDNRQSSHPLPVEKILNKTRAILNALGCADAELSIVILDDTEMAKLNRQYLGREGSTNVLAFPMRDGECADINPQLLGDVVISAPTALREACEAGIDYKERLTELLIHGILHLVGMDHANEAESEIMEQKTQQLLRLALEDH